jgi:hypothetical protein
MILAAALIALAIIGALFVAAACRLAGRADDAQPTVERLMHAEAHRAVAHHDRQR